MKELIKRIANKYVPYEVKKLLKASIVPESLYPTLYNNVGEKLAFFYISADETNHTPYSLVSGRFPKRIVWDRFNFGLDNHFYVSENIFHIKNGGNNYNGLIYESESIIPNVYSKIIKNKQYVINLFDNFYTHSARLLDDLPNSKFVPGSGVWYGADKWGGKPNVLVKNKMISIVSSDKSMCKLHEIRKRVALELVNHNNVDVFGTLVGKYALPVDIFSEYRYHIAIENVQTPYYFTEKLLNCFASKTIPIHLGATQIDKFFNMDGIIQIIDPSVETIKEAVKQCSEEDYCSRMEAIEDNYNRVKQYTCIEDYICQKYPDIIR